MTQSADLDTSTPRAGHFGRILQMYRQRLTLTAGLATDTASEPISSLLNDTHQPDQRSAQPASVDTISAKSIKSDFTN